MPTSFSFSASQLDERMVSVFGSASFENVGINRRTYQLCEMIDTSFHDTWEGKVNKSYHAYYGYDNLEDFKDAYVRAHVYNSLRFAPEKTIRQFVEFYSRKVNRFFGKDMNCNKTNLFDFLMAFTLEELFCVGW